MFGFSGIALPILFQKITFLNFEKIEYSNAYANFNDDSEITFWIFIAFLITLFFKNSNQLVNSYRPNNKIIFFIVILFIVSLMHLDKNVDFIYFNF